jgi:23S rRNA pseudouridine1911/1915/1917 synthase
VHALHPVEQDHEGRLSDRDQASGEDTVVLTFRVPGELEGQRLDRFLEWRIPRLSRERAREIIEACARREDGSARASWERVHADEIVRLVRERFREPDAPRVFGVIHEDPVLVIVDKPPGLPVHPSATYHRNTLTNLLAERYGDGAPHIAHRLDKETSGIVACAPAGPHEVRLKKQFEARTVGKVYLAIVRGVLAGDTRRIELPMRRATSGLHMCMEVHPSGAEAITELEVLDRRVDRTLVRLTPRTGRQHQLRVHMAAIGHPILGDKLYGPGAQEIFFTVIEQGMTPALRAALGHERHALHAHRLTIDHPSTGERVTFESPLPADLVALLGEPPG